MSDRPSRRRVLKSLVSGAAATVAASAAAGGAEPVAPVAPVAPDAPVLALTDFQPKSMLHVPVTQVPRAKFPVIDVHTHLSFAAKHQGGVAMGEAVNLAAAPADVLSVMDRGNIRMMVNLTGNYGSGLAEALKTWQTPHPDRFMVFTEPSWDHFTQPGYPQWQADELGRAKAAGAKGLVQVEILVETDGRVSWL